MKTKGRALLYLSVLALIVGLTPFGAVGAQEIIIDPPPPPHMPPPMAWNDGVVVDEHRVQATINGPIAEVTVTQVFRNDSPRLVEGTYLFPLPEDAAVGDFQMTVNGQVIEGKLMDSDVARGIYEETVRQIRDPALLEYAGRGLYQTSVFPIPPGESRELQLRYGVLLDAENGLHRFSYPLRIPGASQSARRTSVIVDINSDTGLRSVYSPSHEVELSRLDDGSATVRFASEGVPLDSDFELYYGLGKDSIGLNLVSYRPAGEDGYFVLLAAPSIEVSENEIVSRDVVFVVDVSGSMEGPKLGQAKDAVRYVVEHLNAGDRFNLVAFSTGVRLWNEQPVFASAENVADAVAWIESLEASGSTDINRALLEALAQLQSGDDGADVGYVLFMTDGLPTQGETETSKIIRNALANQPADVTTRLFTFGVGFDVNTDLLDTVSRELGGRSRYVRPDQQIDEAVSQFFDTIQTPVLTNVNLDFGAGPVASDVYPQAIPDLFAGEQLIVTGRYRNGGDVTVKMIGEVDGERVIYTYPGQALVNAGGEPFVARLWATRKIGTLMQEIRSNGPNPELIDAIVDLSMRYGIVTPYTSYLVEEPETGPLALGDSGPGRQAPAFDMQFEGRNAVAGMAAAAAEAPASGESAVLASNAREQLMTADTVSETNEVRFAGGKTFVSRGSLTLPDGQLETLWIDTEYQDDMEVETVAFASDQYFQLAQDAAYAEMLALSPEMIIVMDENTALRVTVLDEGDAAYPPPDADSVPSDDETVEGAWEQFWSWLVGR